MSAGRRGRKRGKLRRLAAVLACAAVAGCAARGDLPVRPAPESLPPESPLRSRTLEDGDAWLRHHLMYGEVEQALELVRTSRLRPADRLLRALQEGLLLHRAGQYQRSNEVLEWAVLEADLRYTRSVTRGVGSLALNDRVLAYTPSATELAMIPVYRMLNHLALGDQEGALVEARRLNALLARQPGDAPHRCAVDAMVLHLAGMTQLAGGERSDGLVSLRQAERALTGCGDGITPPYALGEDLYRAARALGVDEVADSAAARYGVADPPPGMGEVVLLVEQGFAPHRAAQALHFPIYPGDLAGLAQQDPDSVHGRAGRIGERILADLSERAAWGESWNENPAVQWGQALEGAYVLRLAWPVARRESHRPAAVRVVVADSAVPVATVGRLSDALERELEAERPLMLTRLVARGLLKYLATREVEEKAAEEGGELLGFLAGRIGNLAANQLERADTRSWSLLPDRVSLARLRLPPGEHHIRLEVVDRDGAVVQARDLGPVAVRPGGMVMLSERIWTPGEGESPQRRAEGGNR